MHNQPLRAVALGLGATVLAVSVLAASGAHAQRTRRPATVAPEPQTRPEPGYGRRGSASYTVPPGYRGTITSSTPNESGNLGGPGTGGGGGDGGK